MPQVKKDNKKIYFASVVLLNRDNQVIGHYVGMHTIHPDNKLHGKENIESLEKYNFERAIEKVLHVKFSDYILEVEHGLRDGLTYLFEYLGYDLKTAVFKTGQLIPSEN